MKTGEEARRVGKLSQLKAILKYELLWNLRKKKVLIMIIIVLGTTSLDLFLPQLLGSGESNPFFLLENVGPRGLIMALLGAILAMNSISGEFEENTIIPLVSKPISRKMIYLGKLLAMLTILLLLYSLLNAYLIIGGRLLYGAQAGLNISILALPFLITLSTTVWISITLLIGTGLKNSAIAAIGTITLLVAVGFTGSIVTTFSPESGQYLNYIPGGGESGQVPVRYKETHQDNLSISTNINNITQSFLIYTTNPTAEVTILTYQMQSENLENMENMRPQENQPFTSPMFEETVRTMSLSDTVGKSALIALAYVVILNLVSIKLFERAEITEI